MQIYILPDTVIVDGKTYVKEPEISVLEVTHPDSAKRYFFEMPDRWPTGIVHMKGLYVICETMRGEKIGRVINVRRMQRSEAVREGAYAPIKKALRLATQQEIIQAYRQIELDLPF